MRCGNSPVQIDDHFTPDLVRMAPVKVVSEYLRRAILSCRRRAPNDARLGQHRDRALKGLAIGIAALGLPTREATCAWGGGPRLRVASLRALAASAA
jgi:hypothetical protein